MPHVSIRRAERHWGYEVTFFARLEERERLIAALIAMCLFAAVIALAMHGQIAVRSAALEHGSLAAPITGQLLHESAGAGAAPTYAVPGAGGLDGNRGARGSDDGSNLPGTAPPNAPQQPPNEPPPSDDSLIDRLLSELPELPPPPFSGRGLFKGLP